MLLRFLFKQAEADPTWECISRLGKSKSDSLSFGGCGRPCLPQAGPEGWGHVQRHRIFIGPQGSSRVGEVLFPPGRSGFLSKWQSFEKEGLRGHHSLGVLGRLLLPQARASSG